MTGTLSLGRARFYSFATGFLSLSWEIVWMRTYNVATGSRAMAFGLMLGSYLLGLALGALLSRRWQSRQTLAEPGSVVGRLILRANLGAFLLLPVVSWLLVWIWWPWTLSLVALSAMSLGVVLPVLCHIAIPPEHQVGPRMASIYLANIIGSGAGSLLTGFLLMAWLPMSVLTSVLLLTAVGVVWSLHRPPLRGLLTILAIFALGILGMQGVWARLQYRADYQWGMTFKKTIEGKHGVITVDWNQSVYGNGVYDGTLDTSLHPGSWLVRPYFIASLHPKPRRVLVIGVSGGAWTQILAHHPDVEEVIGIELSADYLKLIQDSPTVQSLTRNPKVKLVVEDGRRWLKQNPEERFDLVIMNTTHHWREFASALLSQEFLELANAHLTENGIVAWNATDSARSAKTGLEVFPHSMMIINFCVGSRVPLVPDRERWKRLLTEWKIDGSAVLDTTSEAGKAELEELSTFADRRWAGTDRWSWRDRAQMEQEYGHARPITDDNLGHEFDRGNW